MREDLRLLRSMWAWSIPITGLALAALSVIMARYMPEIIDALAPGFPVPEVQVGDVLVQWEKNLGQILTIVAIACAAAVAYPPETMVYLRVHRLSTRYLVGALVSRLALVCVTIAGCTALVAAGSLLAFGEIPDGLWSVTAGRTLLIGLLMAITVATTGTSLIRGMTIGLVTYLALTIASMNSWAREWTPAGLTTGHEAIPATSAVLLAALALYLAWRRLAPRASQ